MNLHEEHIVLLHKEESMLLKIIKMMEIAYFVYFMIQLKAVIIGPEKPMFID